MEILLHCLVLRMMPIGSVLPLLFLLLPIRAISAATVSDVMAEAIGKAGLSELGFSPKDFRPTGATTVMQAGIYPSVVMSLGRWKTTDVFYRHYVHSKPPCEYSDKVFSQ
jgi:integrase